MANYNITLTGAELDAFIAAMQAGQISEIYGLISHVSDTGADTCSHLRVIIASDNCYASGDASASVACTNSNATGTYSAVIGSTSAHASIRGSVVTSSYHSQADTSYSHVIGSRYVISNDNYSVCGGYGASPAATANRKWQFNSSDGTGQMAGALTQSTPFSDFAEMVKNGSGTEIPDGSLLAIFGDKVYPAITGDEIIGIVSATPGALHGDTPFCWQGRFERDEWGKVVKEEVTVVEGKSKIKLEVPKDVSDFDVKRENVPRSQRPNEWTICGMTGIIRTRIDNTVTQHDVDEAAEYRKNVFIAPSDIAGVGKASVEKTNVRVMSVEKEYDAENGYGIAICMIK